MKKELFDKIDERYEMIPEAFGGPVPESEIDEAEEELRVKLPEEYREFIRRYGSGEVGDAVILGLRQAEFLSTPSFVKETEAFRNDLPKEYSNMIVIGVDGAGNPIGFQPPDQTTAPSANIVWKITDWLGWWGGEEPLRSLQEIGAAPPSCPRLAEKQDQSCLKGHYFPFGSQF